MANPNLVNVATINGGNLGFNLSNTLTATLLTVASDVILKINRITVANVDGSSSADVDLFVDGMGNGATGITATGASTVYPWRELAVNTGGSWNVSEGPAVIQNELIAGCS